MKEELYTICVYTGDFRDKRFIFQIRKKLWDFGFDNTEKALHCNVMYYKPDIYTVLEAYEPTAKFGDTYIYIDSPEQEFTEEVNTGENQPIGSACQIY